VPGLLAVIDPKVNAWSTPASPRRIIVTPNGRPSDALPEKPTDCAPHGRAKKTASTAKPKSPDWKPRQEAEIDALVRYDALERRGQAMPLQERQLGRRGRGRRGLRSPRCVRVGAWACRAPSRGRRCARGRMGGAGGVSVRGAVVGRPRCERMASMALGSSTSAMVLRRLPHGQARTSSR
jgi:hypothetical protein